MGLFRKKNDNEASRADSSFEGYLGELREQRKTEGEPFLSAGPMPLLSQWDSALFDLSDVYIATFPNSQWRQERYLLTQKNANLVFEDVADAISLAEMYCQNNGMDGIFPSVTQSDFAWLPEYDEKWQSWKFTSILSVPLTATGKQPKYPLEVGLDGSPCSQYRYSGRLFYTRLGEFGKGEIWRFEEERNFSASIRLVDSIPTVSSVEIKTRDGIRILKF